jgi:hypothetical protein
MNMHRTNIHCSWLRPLWLLVLIMSGMLAQAQGGFTVNGRLKIDGGDIAGARAVVYRNGVKERVITTNLNRINLELALNSSYVLSFEKDGFVAKKLQFDTNVPKDLPAREFTPFEFAVSLFKQYDDMNIVVFNQPVGMIRFESSTGDFDYDTDYTKSIQAQLQKALAEVEEKQKEEVRNASAEAKQQAEAAKAAAKAEAEARKQADAAAKEEALRAEALRKEQERKKEEEERAIAAARVVPAPAPKPVPPPPPVVAEVRPPVPKPAPVAPPPPSPKPAPVTRPEHGAKAVEGADDRRSVKPVLVEEASPVAKAKPVMEREAPSLPEQVETPLVRHEELVVEPNKVITVVRLDNGRATTEYRKVIHKWGDVFYFKNGVTCSKLVYEKEAMSGRQEDDRMVDMAPRR